jgi:hypothetical protein
MCQYFRRDELEECLEDPNFCVVYFMNRTNVKVMEHICEGCMGLEPPLQRDSGKR